MELGDRLGGLAATAAVVAKIALVEHRPSLRLLRIDFDGDGPTLLASVDPASLAGLASLHLPALICFEGWSYRRGVWSLELVTVAEATTVRADELVVVDGFPAERSEGRD